jgi:nucleoside-diphosphate-sugar epimerase
VKFLVTGGAGFIGHNVVRILEKQGHECIVIDTCTDYGFIPKAELTYLINERSKRINARIRSIDIREGQFVDTIFKTYKPDVVIHMASFPRQKVVEQNPLLASDVMCNGLINLLEKSKQYAVKKFVYISSSMVYGDFTTDVLEAHTCRPQGQYGIMKLMGEKLVEDYQSLGCI